jgi:exonuclease VII small subunit
MTKLEQAIAYFEDAIKESDEIIAECSEKLQKELTDSALYAGES